MKRAAKILVTAFILVNLLAVFHAYQFTHFSPSDRGRTNEKNVQGLTDKIGLAFFGIKNPRPENTVTPDRPFDTLVIPGPQPLEAWHIRTTDTAQGIVLLFHGYAGKKSNMLDRAYALLDLGYEVLLIDFSGSGGSPGNSTSIGYHESEEVRQVYENVLAGTRLPVYLFGTSMGAAAILKYLHDHPDVQPAGILLECPFGSMYETVCARFRMLGLPSFPMAGILMFWGGVENGFWAFSHNPETYAKQVNCPALLLYGEKDNRVSRAETNRIYHNLNGQKQLALFPECGHETYLLRYPEKWRADVSRFLNGLH